MDPLVSGSMALNTLVVGFLAVAWERNTTLNLCLKALLCGLLVMNVLAVLEISGYIVHG